MRMVKKVWRVQLMENCAKVFWKIYYESGELKETVGVSR